MLGWILVILLGLMIVGVMPSWGYSSGWGYLPGGALGTILVVVVVLAMLGHI